LHDLIKSLSGSEKRYIRKAFDREGKRQAVYYKELFHILDKMNAFSEEALQKKLIAKQFPDHVAVLKYQLFNWIVRHLRIFHDQDSANAEIGNLIQEAELLNQRNLNGEAKKRLAKAHKMIQHHGKTHWYPFYHAISIETTLQSSTTDSNELHRQLVGGMEKQEQEFAILTQQHQMMHLAHQMLVLYHQSQAGLDGEAKKQLATLQSDPILQEDPDTFPIPTRLYFNQIQALLRLSQGEIPAARDFFQYSVDLYLSNPHLLKGRPLNYLSLLHNLLSIDGATRNEAGFRANFDHLVTQYRQFFQQPGQAGNPKRSFLIYWHIVSYCSLCFHEYQRGVNMILDFKKALRPIRTEFNSSEHLALLNTFFNFSLLCFESGDLSQSNIWLNRVLNDRQFKKRKPSYRDLILFQCVLFFEKADWEFVSHRLQYLQRKFPELKTDPGTLSATLFQSLETLLSPADPDKTKAFLQTLIDLASQHNNPQHKSLSLHNFNLVKWAQKRLSGLNEEGLD